MLIFIKNFRLSFVTSLNNFYKINYNFKFYVKKKNKFNNFVFGYDLNLLFLDSVHKFIEKAIVREADITKKIFCPNSFIYPQYL